MPRFTPEARRRARLRARTLRRFWWALGAPPRMTRVLVLGLVAVHLATGLADGLAGRAAWLDTLWGERSAATLAAFGGRHRDRVAAGELWRLVSYGLLHANLLHLAVNALALHGLGRLAEVVWGRWRTALVFLAAVAGGGLLAQAGGARLSVGASGGVFGLMGALAAFGVVGRAGMPRRLRHVFTRRLVPWIGLNLGLGLLLPFIDNLGHVGGLLTGALVGAALRSDLLAERDETALGRFGTRATVVLLGAAALVGPLAGLAALAR